MASLDRTDPMPLWAQLAADLRRRIRQREFEDRFPTDHDLTAQYQVSRHTVREAIRRLEEEGILERRQGSGTYLVDGAFEQDLNELYSLFRSVEATGLEQRSDVLAQDLRRDAEVAEMLGVPRDRQMFHLARVRYAGSLPLAIDRAFVPLPVGAGLLDVDFRHTALYDELGRFGVAPQRGTERLRPIIPSDADRAALELPAGQPAMEIRRITFHADAPIEYRVTTVRGDRYSFRVEWSSARSGLRTPALVSNGEEVT